MLRNLILAGLAVLLVTSGLANPVSSAWHGFDRLDFTVAGRAALLVQPATPAAGRPWIWRTEFFGHEPQADVELLRRGWHVAYINVANLYGAPVALEAMDAFYDHLTTTHQLASKAVLEGFSRGGLYAFNWAVRHPGRVASLYVDAPVADFRSWPGGQGAVARRPKEWAECLQAYGLSEADALNYRFNPVDTLGALVKAGIPILCIAGGADEVVPFEENAQLVASRYRALGGTIELVVKPGGKHHPHSLPDPALIVTFILKHAPTP